MPNHFKKFFVFVLFFVAFFSSGFEASYAQSSSALYKQGKELVRQQKFPAAIEKFTAAIQLKPDYLDAYSARASCYLQQLNYEKALPDFEQAMKLQPKKSEWCLKAADCYFQLKKYPEAKFLYRKMDEQYLEVNEYAIEQLVWCDIYGREFEEAIKRSSEALNDFKENDYFYFLKGVAYDSLQNFQLSILTYQKGIKIALDKDKKNAAQQLRLKPYFYNLALAQYQLFQFDEALSSINKALSFDANDAKVHFLKGLIQAQRAEYNDALNSLDLAVKIDSTNLQFFVSRAGILKRLSQFNKAIQEYSKVINASDTAFSMLVARAQCFESIGKYQEAQNDYEQAVKIAGPRKKAELQGSMNRLKNRLYEANREQNPPEILLKSPEMTGKDQILVPKSYEFIELSGIVQDQSFIKSISADGVEGDFSRDSLNPKFKLLLNIRDKDAITLVVVDVYLNQSTMQLQFNRKERNPPTVKLFIPASESPREIYFDKSHDPVLNIDGKVDDESYITEISINGIKAVFDLGQINPLFNVKVDLSQSDSVNIQLKDEHGNVATYHYSLNDKEARSIQNNPMGRTWFVFIENSNYVEYESLEGPAKDAVIIKSALNDYRFENRITKKDMTYAEMDRFFRVELRDLVKQQQVNSLLIWFAGHGRYINESGYWIPADAKKNDEATFFPISNLKGYLMNYAKSLEHLLVVSDACESGAAFYTEVSNLVSSTKCNNPLAKAKSSQVFSSTSTEKASDNSIFAQTFASALLGNPNPCMSIFEINKIVGAAVEKNQRQRTRFGKIGGLPNEGGTFLFVRVERE